MKTIFVNARWAVALLLLFILAACRKHKDEIDISGFLLTDDNGVVIGQNGAIDNDWTFNNTLSGAELALFDFTATDTIERTTEADLRGPVAVYPNPCSYHQSYIFSTTAPVLLKMVVVNSKLDILQKYSTKLYAGLSVVQFSYGDSTTYPDKLAMRVYYSFSAKDKPNYKAGYGDIKICRNSNSYPFCF